MTGNRMGHNLIAKSNRNPLYVQVRAVLLQRIASGVYRPGEALPNEFAIADELGVSQGTARKAIDSLARDQLVVRHQGRGTFIAEQTPSDVLFRFFKIYTSSGERVQPSSRDTRVTRGRASARESQALQISKSTNVIRISRTRLNGDTPIIRETIVVPEKRFPGIGMNGVVPNTLYDLFQHQYNVTVTHTSENIEATAARAREARHLQVEIGTPLLKIDRQTYGLDAQPIEWRVSLCHLIGLHYRAELR
jgi:GntR family transcriptional regulator